MGHLQSGRSASSRNRFELPSHKLGSCENGFNAISDLVRSLYGHRLGCKWGLQLLAPLKPLSFFNAVLTTILHPLPNLRCYLRLTFSAQGPFFPSPTSN